MFPEEKLDNKNNLKEETKLHTHSHKKMTANIRLPALVGAGGYPTVTVFV